MAISSDVSDKTRLDALPAQLNPPVRPCDKNTARRQEVCNRAEELVNSQDANCNEKEQAHDVPDLRNQSTALASSACQASLLDPGRDETDLEESGTGDGRPDGDEKKERRTCRLTFQSVDRAATRPLTPVEIEQSNEKNLSLTDAPAGHATDFRVWCWRSCRLGVAWVGFY